MCTSSPSVPDPAPPPPRIVAPRFADENIQQAGDDQRRRQASAASQSGTILTSPLGANPAQTAVKTVLGR